MKQMPTVSLRPHRRAPFSDLDSPSAPAKWSLWEKLFLYALLGLVLAAITQEVFG